MLVLLGRVPSGSREGRVPSHYYLFFVSCQYPKRKSPALALGLGLALGGRSHLILAQKMMLTSNNGNAK